ncbi:VanW family protein [Thermosinus carboxydivorans Nor1]|uniref:VanW family protein n=1 Tax=Thermosinus carboxydivorans Nor1 TaxID=401526 RepID=A1HTF7_9FIRM|nr:VanW family protein [Thermosinus carboxydivorans]EAX46706.1 VanW family protein [Thermosinus carboxydivorans Nor1]
MKFWEKAVAMVTIIALPGCGWLQSPAPKHISDFVAPGVTVEGMAVGGLTRAELDNVLKSLAQQHYRPPKDARFDDETGKVTDGEPGRRLDITATAERVMAALPNSNITGIYQDIQPAISAAQLEQARRLGSYTTEILDASPGRLHNIRLTAKLINNAVVEPGAEFSFNRQTGEPTAERGFKEAPVIGRDGQMEPGLGGGMCQVSSTLYNAVLAVGWPVTERHPHSQPVAYVPKGRDATTYTDKDLRFVNATRQRVVIRAVVHSNRLTVDLWGLSKE